LNLKNKYFILVIRFPLAQFQNQIHCSGDGWGHSDKCDKVILTFAQTGHIHNDSSEVD